MEGEGERERASTVDIEVLAPGGAVGLQPPLARARPAEAHQRLRGRSRTPGRGEVPGGGWASRSGEVKRRWEGSDARGGGQRAGMAERRRERSRCSGTWAVGRAGVAERSAWPSGGGRERTAPPLCWAHGALGACERQTRPVAAPRMEPVAAQPLSPLHWVRGGEASSQGGLAPGFSLSFSAGRGQTACTRPPCPSHTRRPRAGIRSRVAAGHGLQLTRSDGACWRRARGRRSRCA
jgi:hypothetical protein